MSILDISKTKMYDFHYGYVKSKFGPQARLLYTDTDSLLYEIKTDDFYKDIIPDVLKYFDMFLVFFLPILISYSTLMYRRKVFYAYNYVYFLFLMHITILS